MRATEYFMNGYTCSESIVKWGSDEGWIEPSALSSASAFSGGMGSGCLCGAIAGSQMIIGSIYGKGNKFGNPSSAPMKAKELIQKFIKKHKTTCCRVLTRGLEMSNSERKAHCVNMVKTCEELVEEMVKQEALK